MAIGAARQVMSGKACQQLGVRRPIVPDLQVLADEYYEACKRELAVKAGLSADAALIGRIAMAKDSAEQRLFDAALHALGREATNTIGIATMARAVDDYYALSEAERRRLLDGNTETSSPIPRGAQPTQQPIASARETVTLQPLDTIALATAIIQNARPHPVTWGLGHPPYNRFEYLPSGHRDLPDMAPRAFYDASHERSTERDHLVGLAQAHESGAAYWSHETKQAFALDPDNIYSITPATNMAKSYRDPADWMPVDPATHVRYAAEWVVIKTRWSLTYDEAELVALRAILRSNRAA